MLSKETLFIWDQLTYVIDSLYDVDRSWGKGYGDWKIEYNYRRGGKTLCKFYAKEEAADLLITYGKAEQKPYMTESGYGYRSTTRSRSKILLKC